MDSNMDLKINQHIANVGQFWGPEWDPEWLKLADPLKKNGQGYFKSSCLQGGPEMAQDRLEMARDRPKMAP